MEKTFAEFEVADSGLLLFAHDIKQKTLVLLAFGLMEKMKFEKAFFIIICFID